MGQRITCRRCGATFVVPGATGGAVRCPECGAGRGTAVHPQRLPASQGPPLAVWIGIASLVAGVVLAGLVLALWPQAGPQVAEQPPIAPPAAALLPTQTDSPAPPASPLPPSPTALPQPPKPPSPPTTPISPPRATGNLTPAPAAGNRPAGPIGTMTGGGGTGGFQDPVGQEAFSPRVPWSVEPDPLTEPLSFEVPEKRLAVNLRSKGYQCRLVFPNRPSYFVAAANNEGTSGQISILDIRNGHQVSKFSGQVHSDIKCSALSADGQQMATVVGFRPKRIVIADTKSGKAIQNVQLEDDLQVKRLVFAGPGQLVAIVSEIGQPARAGMWDIVAGTPLAAIDLALPNDKSYSTQNCDDIAVSPGGKYFAVAVGNVVCVYDVTTGQLAGELELTGVPRYVSNVSLAFSPSGDELAVVAGGSDGVMTRINVQSGEIETSMPLIRGEFAELAFLNRGNPLQYLPELGCLLLDGSLVIEATTGEAIYGIWAFEGHARVLPESRMVGLYDRGSLNQRVLGEFRLPSAEISKLAETIRAGGTMLDGLLGPAKDCSLTAVKRIEAPPFTQAWALPPMARPHSTSRAQVLVLPLPKDDYSSYSSQPALSLTGSHVAWLPERRQGHSKLFVADVASGKLSDGIDMLPRSRALDLSPDGSRVLVAVTKELRRDNARAQRLEVYSVPEHKHLLAWSIGREPVNNVPGAARSALQNDSIATACFVDNDHVLTRQENGQLVLWKLPEPQPLYVLEDDSQLVGFSPGRQYALLHSRDQRILRWFEVKTGTWCGVWAYDRFIDPALAFSPSGDKIAAVITCNGYTLVRLLNSSNGSLIKELQLPPIYAESDRLVWSEDRYLLIDRILVDLEEDLPVWRYLTLGHALIGPDGRCWFTTQQQGRMFLIPHEVPSDAVRKVLGKLKVQPAQPLIVPGTHVAVQIGYLAGGFNLGEAQQVLEDQIRQRGWVVDANAPFRLLASSQETSRQESYSPTGIYGSPGTQTVAIRTVTTTYQILDQANRELWNVSFTSSADAPFQVHIPPGKTLQEEINKGLDASLRSSIGNLSIPEVIYPPDAYERLHQSRISDAGEVID